VVIHATSETLRSEDGGAEIEGGPVIPSRVARRLACSGRTQVVVEDEKGHPLHVGRVRRDPPAWMVRQLKYRDWGCRFPGCGSRRWLQAHHIVWWERGGTTDLHNLVLLCFFHHKLVHDYGWRLTRDRDDGTVRWFRPDGTRYRAGPAPPNTARHDDERHPVLAAVAF
jgi:hypothetical protein